MARRFFDPHSRPLARVILLLFGMAVIIWAIGVIPIFKAESLPAFVASRIIDGEPYKPDVLAATASEILDKPVSAFRASALDSRTIIALRLAEDALVSGDQTAIDARFEELARAADEGLRSVPTSSFQWLIRFWVEQTPGASPPDHLLNSLRMSYTTGANEAWVALKRSPVAFANFATLPPDLVEAATLEFVGLVRSQLFNDAADILAGPAWPVRELLLARLRDVKEADRRVFARVLDERNLEEDVVVPGIAPPPQRPWPGVNLP
jgi:hypothetical protein